MDRLRMLACGTHMGSISARTAGTSTAGVFRRTDGCSEAGCSVGCFSASCAKAGTASAASRHRVSSRLRQRFFMVIFLSFL